MPIRLTHLLLLTAAARAATAQGTTQEYRPEINLSLPRWHGARLGVVVEQHLETDSFGPAERQQGIVLGGPELDLVGASVELRQVIGSTGIVEHRYIPAVTATAHLGAGVDLRDRMRVELRDIAGEWSKRYQNRATMERATPIAGLRLQPFGYFDLSYDTRYDVLNRREAGIGVRVPVAPGTTVEPFVMRQTDTRKTIDAIVAIGARLRVLL
jgi:hypothetical protein